MDACMHAELIKQYLQAGFSFYEIVIPWRVKRKQRQKKKLAEDIYDIGDEWMKLKGKKDLVPSLN